MSRKTLPERTRVVSAVLLYVCLLFVSACSTPRQVVESEPVPVQQEVGPQTADANITLDDIFASAKYRPDFFGRSRWTSDGTGYLTIERSDSGSEIAKYDIATGARSVIVSPNSLVPSGQSRPLPIHNYHWSDDEKKMLIYTNSKRVWRQNTRGDYWVLDLGSESLQQLGTRFEPSTLMFAKFSPDGERVAYVQSHNIYVEDLATGDITALTTDGSRTTINGTFDWVYEEEFFLQDGFRWSPDGTNIAYWQLDASGVRDFLMINNTDSLYSFTIPVQYPKAGQTNSSSKIGVVNSAGGETRWFTFSDDPRNNYVARMEWADGSDELIVQHLNRQQNRNEVYLANVVDGSKRIVHIDEDEAWVDVVDDLIWLDGGQRFTWVSESSGWRKLYAVNRTGGGSKNITQGEFDIISVVRIDKERGYVYYYATENPTERYLYRSSLSGDGERERLTPADQVGVHAYDVSTDGQHAIHTHSSFDTPPVVELITLPEHRQVRLLVDNESLADKVEILDRPAVRFFRVAGADGVELDGWEMLPRNFNPDKEYPVLFFVYGEPWNQTVVNRWGGTRYLWHHLLTEQGYIVMSFDNRGTPAPRGRAWRKVVHGRVGVHAAADQAAAAEEVAKLPYVDGDRIGIWGWSGGGSQTLNSLFRYPDRFKMGVSVAPVPDQRYYDSIYQERYSGLPQENPEGYREGSPITYAHQLKADLLLIHGTGDDNVHYQGTEALVNELIKHNKQFSFMAYPNRSHGIFEGTGTTMHLYTLITDFILQKL